MLQHIAHKDKYCFIKLLFPSYMYIYVYMCASYDKCKMFLLWVMVKKGRKSLFYRECIQTLCVSFSNPHYTTVFLCEGKTGQLIKLALFLLRTKITLANIIKARFC